ncbi:MAG: bifunctional methylenetetrahydrofolate dehydrogenase/methenyltetrahydrofolate cyclohydrolase FolD [Gemmatales bacterium]|nr:bifunctional methylenetetrahydrofolate dehydrogenase/methenyltetrahydrofolate cyclohydrolase FolD [Gemmatales bacterium]MDW8175692.1 bifunctional methylenetetrahydrofolate dehydrogenase/methenyltetrahydrofolate cyclohydrolase FolD [Gemmatales bacterium]
MTARLLDGKRLAEQIREEIRQQVERFYQTTGQRPGLAAVLVGDNPASQIYVRNKRRACEQVGMVSWLHHLPGETTEAQLLALVRQLNDDPVVHGILVQLPLPRHIREERILEAVAPNKDIDGFGPENLGRLAAGRPRFVPCTPLGVQVLLRRHDIAIAGRHVVILGRSTIVGKPLALLLLHKGPDADATVTVCHSRTQNLAAMTRQADILVAAMGQPRFVRADMIKPGAVIVDVGINRLPDGTLVGDVDHAAVAGIASAITPVPGGVGPMTVAMLLHNTLRAAQLQAGLLSAPE